MPLVDSVGFGYSCGFGNASLSLRFGAVVLVLRLVLAASDLGASQVAIFPF